MLAKPSDGYSSEDLSMLSRVLGEALEASIDGAGLSELQIQDLSSRLGKVIMDRFTAGETDPAMLKKIAVDSVQQR